MKPLRNISVLSLNATGTLLAPRARHTHPDTTAILHTLRFMGYRLVATADPAALKPPPQSLFEKIFTTPTPPLATMARILNVAPVDILHIGDDLDKDINAAQSAGMRAAWLAPNAHFRPKGAIVLQQLAELPELLRDAETGHLQHKPDKRTTRNLIANLRNLPEELPWSPNRRHENPARPIGPLILEVASKLSAKGKPLDVLKKHWAQIVNAPKLSSKSEPHTVTKNGILAIHCEDSIVRTDIDFQKEKILAAIRLHPACANIKGLKFHL
jgi:hypothetical protein